MIQIVARSEVALGAVQEGMVDFSQGERLQTHGRSIAIRYEEDMK